MVSGVYLKACGSSFHEHSHCRAMEHAGATLSLPSARVPGLRTNGYNKGAATCLDMGRLTPYTHTCTTTHRPNCKNKAYLRIRGTAAIDLDVITFPPFLPPEVKQLRDPAARAIASRIQRLPVQTNLAEKPIMTSCIKPAIVNDDLPPVFLLHGFDSSCLEWRYTYPKLEKANLECWAFDILGWGFSYSEDLMSVGVQAKQEHLYEFWRSYIKKPMVLVGASLGGAAAIDFTLAHPEAVAKLVLVNAQGYAEGTGKMTTFPKFFAYAAVSVLKNVFLRTYANFLIYHQVKWGSIIDQMNVGRLHCFMPGWAKASVDFMLSGGYNVAASIPKITKETLVIWGEQDRLISKDTPERFKQDLPNGRLVFVSRCGHLPHIEKPEAVAALIAEFCRT